VSEETVANDPASFEDNGTLMATMQARPARTQASPGDLSDLSDEEREILEDCLDSTERPYPLLKRKLGLPLAVRCAEELWAEND